MKKLTVSLLCLIAVVFATDIEIGITGNNRGLLTPCGCKIPSGGWARISTMMNGLKNDGLRVGAGNQFFHHTPMPKEDQIFEQQKAAFQAMMFSELAYEVINIGQFDLCYGLKVLRSFQQKYSLPFISANIQDMDGNPAFPAYKIVKIDGLDIMFVGVCLLDDGHNFKIADPLKALIDLEDDRIFDQADLVILLADAPAKMLSDFVKDHDGIDMIVGAKEHAFTGLPIHYNNTALVQLGSQGKYFGQLNISFKNGSYDWSDISPNIHAVKSAERSLRSDPEHKKKFKRQLKKQRKALKEKINNNPNYYEWNMTLMDNSVKDEPAIRKRVEEFTPYP